MPGDTGTARVARLFREQSVACGRLGSPMYEALLRRAADDALAGGPLAEVVRGHEDDPARAALALRLAGSVHRLVLAREAPRLAVHYPSVGGRFTDADAAFSEFRAVVEDRRDDLRPLLDQPPQTNEVGRAAALLGGLLHVAAAAPRPIRLVEIGASAGLNLRADRFRYGCPDGRTWGPAASPVMLPDAWSGDCPPLAAPVTVVARAGCDLAPLDPATTEGRLTLTSYVWPDQTPRLERLRGAFAVAAQVPATVVRSGAAEFLHTVELAPGHTTVVWHSVMWQYLSAAERAAAEDRLLALGAAATDGAALAHLAMEPRASGRDTVFAVTLRRWPGGTEQVLGTAAAHGPPVVWRG